MGLLRKTIGRALIGACLVLGVGAGAVSAAAGGGVAQLRAPVCQRALDPPARAISVTAVMRPVKDTQHMEMEFQLLMKAPSATAFTAVAGTGLGTWLTPTDTTLGQRPGDIWILNHPVADLAAPADYHFVVSFRWLGTGSQVLKTVTRTGHNCYQPELRPDLYVQSFTAQAVAGHPNIDQFTAIFGNQGGGPARNFEVQFTDGAKVVTRTVAFVAKGATRTMLFQGPACVSSSPPTLVLDPTSAVDDLNRANNTATATCPSPLPSGPTGTSGVSGLTGATRTTGRHRL
jgi:hypothetical protein